MSVAGDDSCLHMATPQPVDNRGPGRPRQERFGGTGITLPFNDGAEAFALGGSVFLGLRISRLLLRCPLAIGSLLLGVRAFGANALTRIGAAARLYALQLARTSLIAREVLESQSDRHARRALAKAPAT